MIKHSESRNRPRGGPGKAWGQADISRKVIIERNIPKRTDPEGIAEAKERKTKAYKTKVNMDFLYGAQRGNCNGCDEHFRSPSFSFDHIHPQSKEGGDEIDNLQLLCSYCNSTKHDDSMEDLWERLYERQLTISPAGWKYLRQRGCKDWRIA